VPQRSEAGYRLYGAAELQRLRTLRELTSGFDIGLGEIGFAMRMRRDEDLAAAVDAWFAAEPQRPDDVPPAAWLRWEQDKHSKLLALAAAHATPA
jgi:MerR family copper efflux transcriptional regulator